MNCACAILQLRRRYRRSRVRRRPVRRYRRHRRYGRRHRFTTNRVYNIRLTRQFRFTIRKQTTSTGQLIFNSDYITFTLSDFLGGAEPQALNWEDYRIKLAKMEMRPTGTFQTISAEGFGHTAIIQDSRIKIFKMIADQQQDPLAPFDGAKKWFLNRGFKRLLRPKPQLTITDLNTANQSAALWLNSTRTGWIPIGGGPNQAGDRVAHYGIAFSFPQPNVDISYLCKLTLYVQFRQWCPNNPST
uniref:Cap n=1 Tax=Beak and feather disease virus TaxID=77856 RepID=A0A4P9I889_BFDV|nr:Cap [Beak and feather disease virus]